MTRIYTKKGDDGQTGLVGGAQVPKDDSRVEAYGAVDELNAALGVVVAHGVGDELRRNLESIQSRLFELGAELATPSDRAAVSQGIGLEDIAWLESVIDATEVGLEPLKSFILPGGSPVAAALHVARGVCRRAERRVVTLRRAQPEVSRDCVVFLNRLGDLLFVLARQANHEAGIADRPWKAR